MAAVSPRGMFTFSAPGTGVLAVDLSRFVSDLDLREIGDEMFDALEGIAEEQHAEERTARGAWALLSDRYRDWKETKYSGPRGAHFPRIMSLSGATHESLTRRGGDAIRIAERARVTYGTAVNRAGESYPLFHQLGQGRLPQRLLIAPPAPGRPIPDRWRFFARILQREAVRLARAKLTPWLKEATESERAVRNATYSGDAGAPGVS